MLVSDASVQSVVQSYVGPTASLYDSSVYCVLIYQFSWVVYHSVLRLVVWPTCFAGHYHGPLALAV